ncbi:hypothetical protein [Streptomyces sp. NPDC093260]|uniref:hypothetical protein n=1 Tax=Streptomyces sp. NPDC093260 TaxID=3155073 RepID=UPI0034308C88
MNEHAEDRDAHERHGHDARERRDSSGRREPFTPHEPTRPPERPNTPPHAGNGTVKHSPDEQGPAGLDSDELDLRRMLHRAVEDVEPRDGALDHLRRAVPARRARKRQAAVGMAAAALFLGTAVPALVHVSGATGSDADPAIAGQASQAQGGTGQGKSRTDAPSTAGGAYGRTPGPGASGRKDDPTHGGSTAPGAGSTAGTTGPSASADAGAPVCTPTQLGSATGSAGAPDSAGVVYGTFHVTNVSAGSCTVGGPGAVTALAQGTADASKIHVVQHTAGDPATGLPAPAPEASALVLAPGAAYEVKFAWVPSETCPTGGSGGGTGSGGTETGGPSPDPSPSQGASATDGTTTGTDPGATTQLVTRDGGTDAGSVVVSHTPDGGAPTATATVPHACAGTVYRTEVLPAP